MRRRRSKKRSNALICEELEPRILLSADLVGVAVDPASNEVERQVDETELQTIEAGLQSVLSNQTDESDISTRELVIIDPATPHYQSLVDDMISRDVDGRSFEIVLLDSSANGIEQLNETLAQYQGLNAIHLISHGGEGEIRLGDATLNQDGLQQSAEQISAWGEALNPGGDWLIYGCDIASTATGERFIEQFAALTGADVAASNDVTGHETLGGDWDLEVTEGSVETDVAVGIDGQQAWLNRLDITTGLLGHWTLDSNATDSSGNSHDGTLTNGASIDNPGLSNPIGDGNLNLDGFNDFVQLNTHVSAFSGLSEGTIAAWINTSYSSAQAMFSITDTADLDSFVVFGMDNGRIFFDIVNNSFYSLSVETNASYADGSWHHVAVTVDGSGNSIYIDGVEVSLAGLFYRDGNSSTSSFFSSVTSLDSMAIGNLRDAVGYTGSFNGLQDDVRVYDRALSASDIADLLSNTAPTFDVTLDGAPTFIEDGAAVVLDADVDVKDAELDALNSGLGDYDGAGVTLVRNGAANSDDVFDFNDGNGISLSGSNLIKSSQIIASFDTTSTAGELVITFTNANGQTPTSADVDNILRQITYSNSNDAPPASVQIDWTFDDGNTGSQGSGGALQAVGSTTVTISAVNDDPTNAGSLSTDITVAENVSSNVDLSAVDFSDVDAGAGTLTVTLTTSTGGNLSAAAGTGITIGGTSTARTLTGTLTDLNNYFNTASNITYLHGTPDINGDNADTINVTINDNGNTGTGGGTNINLGTVNVDITPDNEVPTITNLGGDSLAYNEDDGAQVIDQGTASVVADVDSSDFDTGTLTVSFQAGSDNAEDVLAIRDQGAGPSNITVSGSAASYGGTQIGTFTGGSGGTNLVITLDADADATAVTALVRNITYENTDTENPTTGARTVRFVLTDGDGGTSVDYDTTVTVSTVNDAPTLAATAANDTLTENTDTTSGAVFGTVTIDPIEAGDDIASAQLTLGGGIDNSDTLTINGTAISGLSSNSSGAITGGHSYSYTQATGVVTINFAASTNAAAAELVLESITYGI
ncbi:MAG: DUF4347 domain-containing protein, partial [Candidatus Thiodiazotropha sp.]